MSGRARGRMFDIRPEHDDMDPGPGTGSYPGYPGYGETGDGYAGADPAGPEPPPAGRSATGRNGSDRSGAPPAAARPGARTGVTRGTEAPTTAVRAVRGSSGRFPADDQDRRVAPDGRWDDEEPPLLSHRNDEPAYARDHTPQGFDGGDPDDPAWGRGGPDGYQDDDYYDEADPAVDDRYEREHPDGGYGDEDDGDDYDEDEYGVGDAPLSVPPPGSGGRPLGPADVEELDPSMTDALARVDLGSVQVPVPYGAEMKLEPSAGERPQAVHLLLPEGRIAVSALAAPRSSGLWADLAAEIEASLRKGGARVRNARGDWGRELHARTENAASVFVGCDGPRWMVYGVATASLETVEALDVELRRVLRGIIVVRGRSPYPPRTVLPLELPERLRKKQPAAAPPKASITVSVPAPPVTDDDEPTTAAVPGPRNTGATPREPVAPPRHDGARPAPTGPPSGPVRRPTEPATRALPQVERPSRAAASEEDAVERTAVAGPSLRPRPEEPAVASGVPAGGDDVYGHPDRAVRSGRPRPGRPDRPDRARGAGRPDRGALARRHPAPAPWPDERMPGRGVDERSPASPAPDTPAYGGRPAVPEPATPPAPVRRDPAVTALSAADLLAGTAADPAARDRSTGRPARSGAGDAGFGHAAGASGPDRDDLGLGREAATGPDRAGGPQAIEDIPLGDVPLLEATLDRGPAPEPPVADPPPRRRRRDPDAGRAAAAPGPDAEDQDWLSAEIAATRRSGRHGAGTGTARSVADILASAATGDTPRGGTRDDAPPADPAPGGDDLFGSPAGAAERYRSTPDRRNGHRATGRPAADDDPAGDGTDRATGPGSNGHRANGHPVTGLADYRRTRASARDAGRADPLDGPAHEPEAELDPWTGRAVGGSGLTGGWSSGRRGAGTDPRDLGRHRRD